MLSFSWAVVIFYISAFRLLLLLYTQPRPIPHWRVVMFSMLSIAALPQLGPFLVPFSFILYAQAAALRVSDKKLWLRIRIVIYYGIWTG